MCAVPCELSLIQQDQLRSSRYAAPLRTLECELLFCWGREDQRCGSRVQGRDETQRRCLILEVGRILVKCKEPLLCQFVGLDHFCKLGLVLLLFEFKQTDGILSLSGRVIEVGRIHDGDMDGGCFCRNRRLGPHSLAADRI